MNLFKLGLSFFALFVMLAFIAPSTVIPIEKISTDDFSKFLKMFPEKELPFSITNEDIDEGSKKERFKTVENIFYKILPNWKQHKFSRMPGPAILPIQSFRKDELIAVIYSTHNIYTGRFPSFYCSTFNAKGQFLETFQLGSSSLERSTTFTIDKNLIVEKVTYENVWKNCVHEYGFQGNEVVKRNKKEIKFFQIKKNGTLKKLKEYKTTARASL